MASLIEPARQYLSWGWAVIPTVNKKPCISYTELPPFNPTSKDCFDYYLKQFEEHPEAQGIALVLAPEMLVLDLDSSRAEAEFNATTKDATGIKTSRGSKYLFFDLRPDLIDSCISLRDIAGSAKFHIREDVEIILEGMLCELPPGLHPSGQRYEWINEPINGFLTPLPDILFNEVVGYGETRKEGKSFLPGELERLLQGLSEGEGRNEAAIRIAGHLIGKNNNWDVIESFLKSWNQKNNPPLSDKELEGVLESAHKYYDEKLNTNITPKKETEIKELTIDEIRERKESFKDRKLSLVLPPNHFVSIYRNWLSGITDGYEDYQTMGALWIISSFCDYNVNVRLKQETVRPNISVIFFGRSTTSRKSTTVNRTRQVHESVTGSYLPNKDFSLEGYLESLDQNSTQHHVRDEVAGFLAKIHKQYNDGFNELECALYDGQNFRKTLAAKGNKEPRVFNIKSPYITKLYATTPDNYFKYMEIEDFLCGKEFRTLFVYPTYNKNRMALGTETQQDVDNWALVLQCAGKIYNFITNSNGIEFKFEPGALEYYSDITLKMEEAADKTDNSILSSAVGRSQIHILKLAMLIELGKEQISTTITTESLAISANAVVTYFIPTLMDVVDLMQEDIKNNMIEKVVYVIRRHGGAIQHTKALHDSKLKSRDFAEVIKTLIESEAIEIVIETTSKKPYYILTEMKKSLDLTFIQPATKNLPNHQNLPSHPISYGNTSTEIFETSINITQSDIACLEKNNILSCEVKRSNNTLSLQNLSHNSYIRDGEIQEIREIKEIQTVRSCVVSVEEAERILEEEGF